MELKVGSNGKEVIELQRFFGIEDDGKFGNQTRLKVLEYQWHNNLEQTGIVDDLLWSKIFPPKQKGIKEVIEKKGTEKVKLKASPNCISLIKKHEGCKLEAYLDSVKVPTIGYGNTYYEDNSKVKIGDKITQDRANELLLIILKDFEDGINKTVTTNINQNQFDALVCFVYNIGLGNFRKSTVLKLINVNPADEAIGISWNSWNKAGGKVLKGLVNRRKDEYSLYTK